MPHTSYAILTAMRSHRIDSPSVAASLLGRPNACNLCHLDQTLEWTANHLSDWYGIASEEMSEDQRTVAASLLWLLSGDAVQRAIVAWHMGWGPALEVSGNRWQAPLLAKVLNDPYSAVRYIAGRSMRQLRGFEDFSYDFIGPDSERAEVIQRVLSSWRQQDSPDRTGTAVLTDSNGPISEQVDRLLRLRDDRPVTIPE